MARQPEIIYELRSKNSLLKQMRTDLTDIENRKEELMSKVTDESTVEEIEAVDAKLNPINDEEIAKKKEISETEDEVDALEKELEEIQKELTPPESDEGENRNMDKDLMIEKRDSMNTYIRSRGKELRAGITSTDVGVVIPEEIAYNPELEVNTVQDLSTLVTKTKVNSASGKYPILKRATAGLSTVAELEENPALAKPEFLEVAWEVETYRGAIPLSQESIDDAQVDLVALVARNAQEQKINTTNARIATVLKSFTAKTAADTDGLKAIFNVDLDPAYNTTIVASQSFFHALDTLKDGDGRYLLQDDITSPSGKRLFGKQVVVVNDTLLGAAGDSKAFIGDLKRGVLFADRKDIALDWMKHEIYGKYLAVVLRMDVKKADANAGYFVTLTPTGDGA